MTRITLRTLTSGQCTAIIEVEGADTDDDALLEQLQAIYQQLHGRFPMTRETPPSETPEPGSPGFP